MKEIVLQAEPIKAKLTLLFLICLTLGTAVTIRSAYIQLIRDRRVEEMARQQFQSRVMLRPRRGSILDRNGEPLAVNIETQSLAVNPSKILNKRTMANLLAKATDQPSSRIFEKLQEKREFAWIKRHLSETELQRLKKWHLSDSLGNMVNGLWLVKESKRVYPHGELAAHILGDVNVDSIGLEGVELWANKKLEGKLVPVKAIKDALGRPIFIDAVAAQRVQDGASVSLTIDASLQFSVEQELRSAVQRTNAKGGTVIVMNAVTGEILALANDPSFNPNNKNTPVGRRRNRAVTDGLEPGSILKPILLATSLAHGWKLNDRIWGERGSFVLQGKRINEAETHEKFEWINLKKIIQVSSNVGAAKLALRLGTDHFYHGLKVFGFGEKTNLGFPGEILGKIPPKKTWQPLTLANIGFGQGILVTPLQMIRAYSVFANGGWLIQPTLLQSPLKDFRTIPPQRILNQKVNSAIVESLLSVTQEGGTGIKAHVEGYQVAGKTGTAQFFDVAYGKYISGRYISSFIGFPVGVEPKIVIYTSLEEPKGIYYASETAAPLFHDLFNATATRFSLPGKGGASPLLAKKEKQIPPPTPKKIVKNLNVEKELASLLDQPIESLQWQGLTKEGTSVWKMPSLHRLTAREAVRILKGHQFQVEVSGNGLVKSQFPEAGKLLAEKGVIRLTLESP